MRSGSHESGNPVISFEDAAFPFHSLLKLATLLLALFNPMIYPMSGNYATFKIDFRYLTKKIKFRVQSF